jgi:hypothetical protein
MGHLFPTLRPSHRESPHMNRKPVRLALAAGAVSAALLLSGCDALIGGGASNPFLSTSTATAVAGGATPTPVSTCDNYGFESVFSAYGTVHYERVLADNLTLDFQMYTDQKTHDWTPELPNKQINFTINVVDSNATVDDPFADKRKVYLSELELTADTVTATGEGTQALDLNLSPRKTTLDPEALHRGSGLLITSPKGGYQRQELTVLPAISSDSIGMNLTFRLKLVTQKSKGSSKYSTNTYTIKLPVAVFSAANAAKTTSCATSSTLAPVTSN